MKKKWKIYDKNFFVTKNGIIFAAAFFKFKVENVSRKHIDITAYI